MTKFAVFALVLINAAFASQVFLGTNSKNTAVINKLKAMENSPFGKNLLDTIALQLKNQSPLADIATLLGELKSELLHDQQDADRTQAEHSDDCATSIAEYNSRLAAAGEEIQESTGRIEQITNRIGELELSTAQYAQAIEDTTNERDSAIAERAARAAQFDSRTAQHQGVIEALDLILEKLGAYGNPQTPDEAVLLQLAKIGKSNPIAAFVQVAASLDPSAWQTIRDKLTALRDATQQSLTDDAAQEALEISNFNDYVNGLNNLLDSLRTSLATDEADLAEQRADLADQQLRLSNAQTEFSNATDGLHAKQDQCDQWRAQYDSDTAHRSAEVDIIEQVQAIFAQRLDTASDYLQSRIDQ